MRYGLVVLELALYIYQITTKMLYTTLSSHLIPLDWCGSVIYTYILTRIDLRVDGHCYTNRPMEY
jgi:hypothetical protein